jgi:glycerol-3-phosphate acyltransferase PlsY
MGWSRAVAVGLLDLSKGALPILIARALGAPIEIQALTGVAAVLGAWKSVFLRFHGGRGVATGVGGMLVISPLVCLIAAPAFFVIIGVTRYVSLGSLLGTAFGALVAILFVMAGALEPAWLLYVLPGLLIVWIAHWDNIQRLLAGTERRFDPGDRQARPSHEPEERARPLATPGAQEDEQRPQDEHDDDDGQGGQSLSH